MRRSRCILPDGPGRAARVVKIVSISSGGVGVKQAVAPVLPA